MFPFLSSFIGRKCYYAAAYSHTTVTERENIALTSTYCLKNELKILSLVRLPA